jgi:ATP-dependent Clp protease protease subunit
VPAVTELVISELLWLNYSSPEKPVYVYLNSIGSQTADGQAVGFETEAYAILDTLNYIRPDIHTLVVGQAYGNAAMILASGKKGCRFSLPNARIMTAPPRLNRSFGSASNIMIKANELENNTQTYVDFLSSFTGKDKETVRKDVGRNRYFTPQQAIDYGLVDRIVQVRTAYMFSTRTSPAKHGGIVSLFVLMRDLMFVLQPEDAVAIEERNYEAQLMAAQSQQQRRRPAAAAAADT